MWCDNIRGKGNAISFFEPVFNKLSDMGSTNMYLEIRFVNQDGVKFTFGQQLFPSFDRA